jgi:hypothetical protein
MSSGNGRCPVVEHLSADPEIKGSNPGIAVLNEACIRTLDLRISSEMFYHCATAVPRTHLLERRNKVKRTSLSKYCQPVSDEP